MIQKTPHLINIQSDVPFDGNSPITMYQVLTTDRFTDETKKFNSNSSNITVRNLVLNRQYTMRVRVKNNVGYGNLSAPLTVVTDVLTGR